MDEKQLEFLFKNYAFDKGFADFNEFKGLMSDDNSRKVFFEASNKELGFKDLNDFDSTLGFKKKDLPVSQTGAPSVGQPSKGVSQSQSPLGLVDDISTLPKNDLEKLYNEKKKQLSDFETDVNRFKLEGSAGVDRLSMATNQYNTAVQDLNYIADTFKNIYGNDKELSAIDNPLPVIEDPRQKVSNEFKKGLSGKKKQLYTEQGFADAESRAIREVNNIYSAINQSPDYETALKRTGDLRQQVFDATAGDGESREELLSKLKYDALGIGKFLLKDANALKNTGGVTPIQKAGLDYLKIFNPERYESLLNRARVVPETNEQRAGQQINNLELETTGLSVLKTGVSDLVKDVQEKVNKGIISKDSQEVKNLNSWIQYISKAEDEQLKNYPEALSIRAQQTVNDVDKERLGFFGRSSYNLYKATGGAVEGLVNSLVKRFMGDEDKTRMDLESVSRDAFSYLGGVRQNASIVNRDYLTVFSDKLKQELGKIDSDTKLTDAEKFTKKSEIVKNATPSEIYSVINPNKSKINLTAESFLGVLSTVVPQVVGGLATSYLTGGFGNISKARQLSNLFITSAATSYGQRYDQAMATGAANAEFNAIAGAIVDGGTELIGNDIAQIKKAISGGVGGKILSKLSDADWNRILANKNVRGGLIRAGVDLTKDVSEEVVGESLAQVGGNIIEGNNPLEGVKETAISTLIGVGAFRAPIVPYTASKNNIATKYAFYSAGFNNNQTIKAIKDQIASGDLTEQEGNKRIEVVSKMNGIINTMPFFDKNGDPLSDDNKAKYAYNEYIKQEAKSSSLNMPSKQAEELKQIAQKADEENGAILDGQELSKIESGMAVDKEGQLIEKKEQIKERFGLNDEDFVEETFTQEEDAADRDALPESDFKTEEELINFLETGEYGMLTGQNPDAVPLSKNANRTLNERATQWLADRGLKAIPIFGKYGNSERSFLVPGLTKAQAIEFAKEFQQDSVAHSSGLVYKDGSFNPRNGKPFTEPMFNEGGDFFSTINVGGKTVDFVVPYDTDTKIQADKTVDDSINTTLSNAVDTAAKSLEKAGIKFSIIDSSVDGDGAARGNQAVFVSETGEIIIDKSKLQDDIEAGIVVWHEASHPVMNILRNTNKELYDSVVKGLTAAAKKDPAIGRTLGWAVDNYDGDSTRQDEALVEVVGRINAGIIDINKLDTGFRQKLIDFINGIAKYLGIDPIVNDTDIAQFKKTVSEVADALKTGRDIAEIVGEENVKEYMNKIDAPEAVAAGSYDVQARTTENSIDVYESKEVDALPRRSLEDIHSQFEGKAVVINSDPTRVGELTLPSGKKIFMYGGPGYLSVKDNVNSNIGFATTQLSKVKSWAKYISDVFGNNPGVTLVATQAPTSMLSNSYALRYVMDAISTLPKSVLRSSDFKTEFFGKDLVLLKDAFGEKAYNEFVSKYKKADLSDKKVIDDMIAEMAYKVGDDNKPASFKARGAFVSNLLGGLAPKSSIKTIEGDTGYVSKKPQKFIAKQLMDRLGINAEKVIRDIGEPSLVDLYMNEGKWGMAVSGFETDPNLSVDSVQEGGVKHPLFNAKFPGKNPFILDGAYEVDKIFKPVEMTGPSGEPYTKKAAQMLAGSMYVKGMPTEVDGTFEYTKSAPAGGAIQASVGNRIPEAKQKKLTDDKKGNYVFFHRTAGKLNKIDPKKFGSNTATGRDERPGVGISMFYTDSKTGEPGVPDNFIYAVRVPKEKVYSINEDPLNFYDEAKAMFDKDFPGQAFDANKQVGYITKVANEKGFDMTVVDWNIKGKKALRAQTTQAVKPEAYKTEEFRDGITREVFNPELEKLKPGIQKSAGNRNLAPNGKPSNLNDKQYQQVRTPEFKNWFGDWENDPKNASKVVDENGEPMVVYHGSVAPDIEIFDRTLSKRESSGLKEMGVYFTTNRKLAEAYSEASPKEEAEGVKSRIYEAFLNIRKAKEFDANGKNGIRAWDNLQVDAGYKIAQNRDAMDFLMNGKFGVEKVDGIIANNIVDLELYGYKGQELKEQFNGTVFLVFDDKKNSIKSATDNVGTFSTTDNRIQASAGKRTAADFGESADPKTKITLADLGVSPGMSSKELLDNLLSFGGTFNPLLKAIAKKKNLGDLQIANMNEITDDPYEAAGGFVSKFNDGIEDKFKGKLYINTKADELGLSTNQYYTLTHELMHWVTLDSLNTPVDSPAYNKLKDIYQVLSKKADTTPGFGTFETYGLSNFNEFMAELFISAKFRNYVQDVTGSTKDLKDSKDLIDILVDYLRDLFAKVFKTDGGSIDPNRPLIDQATEVAKEMFFGNTIQASVGGRTAADFGKFGPENSREFKTAAYVMRSKADGMSDAEIATGLLSVTPGMTPQEAKDIIGNPEAYIRSKFNYLSPALQENLINRARVKNIYAKSKTTPDAAFDNLEVRESSLDEAEISKKGAIKKWLGDFKRQWLDAAKGLPNWVLAIKDISSGVKDLQIRQATDMVKDLKKTAESIGFNDWDAFSKAMRSMKRDPEAMSIETGIQPWFANIPGKQLENAPAVIPQEIAALPEEIIPFVYSMRGMIDNLSSELVASGFVTPSQALTLTENLGEYINRAYKLFNEKGYKPSKESIRDARKFLADKYIKQLATESAGMLTLDQIEKKAIDMANKDIETIISKKLNPYFKKNDSRDTGVLKERKDIPAPIRKLMGEYTDPGTAFIITVAKQASLKAASQYLTGLRNNGLGNIFFEENDPNRPVEFSVKISSEGSDSKSPLNGLYTTPDIAEALESVGPTFNDLTNAWMKLVGAVRWGKTVGSVVTQVKNFESNLGFAVMNGLIFSGENTQALKGASKYFSGQVTGKKLDELTQKAMALGLVNQSVGTGELRKMLGSGDIHDIAVELAVTGKTKGAMNWIGKPFKAANKLYQLSDDFWKVYGYLNERELMSNALYNKKYDELSADEQTTVDLEASERVKMTQPTYDRVWAGAKYVSERAPIFGNFISFQAEVVRVLNNTIKIAARDMKSDNPKVKALGYKRFAGMMTYVALRTTLTYAAAQAAGIGVAGLMGAFDDEEEKEKEAGMRKSLPPFMRTGDLLIIPQKDPSKFTVFELSSLDPYGIVFKSMNALTEGREGVFGDTMDPGVPAAMAEFFSGFLEQEMTFKTFNDLMNNTNPRTGEKIIKSDQTKSQAFLEGGKFVANQLKPSTIGLVERLLGKTPETELGSMFGARPYEVDLNRSFGRAMAQSGKDMEDVVKEYGKIRFDKELTPAEKKEKIKLVEERLAYYAKNLSETYRQFLLLGADKKQLDEMIRKRGQVKSTGFNKAFKRSILTGDIKPETYFK